MPLRFKIILIELVAELVFGTIGSLLYRFVLQEPWLLLAFLILPGAALTVFFFCTVRCPHCGHHLMFHHGAGLLDPLYFCPYCGGEFDKPV